MYAAAGAPLAWPFFTVSMVRYVSSTCGWQAMHMSGTHGEPHGTATGNVISMPSQVVEPEAVALSYCLALPYSRCSLWSCNSTNKYTHHQLVWPPCKAASG